VDEQQDRVAAIAPAHRDPLVDAADAHGAGLLDAGRRRDAADVAQDLLHGRAPVGGRRGARGRARLRAGERGHGQQAGQDKGDRSDGCGHVVEIFGAMARR